MGAQGATTGPMDLDSTPGAMRHHADRHFSKLWIQMSHEFCIKRRLAPIHWHPVGRAWACKPPNGTARGNHGTDRTSLHARRHMAPYSAFRGLLCNSKRYSSMGFLSLDSKPVMLHSAPDLKPTLSLCRLGREGTWEGTSSI